jgi:hypothetical protein
MSPQHSRDASLPTPEAAQCWVQALIALDADAAS